MQEFQVYLYVLLATFVIFLVFLISQFTTVWSYLLTLKEYLLLIPKFWRCALELFGGQCWKSGYVNIFLSISVFLFP